MLMSKLFTSIPYPINDFKDWYERKQLILSPKFQRRRVWQDKAKSYLIDTILRGYPMPPIFVRQIIDRETKKTMREVIDGQQRLSTILDYIKDGFKVMEIHNDVFGNQYFSELPDEVKDDFLNYNILTNTINTQADNDVLAIFARLNTYTVPLNKQELWNAKYFGLFKQTVHNLAYDFNTFWTKYNILTQQNIARMKDVEVTSELIIASLDGIQSNKVIENYYKNYDDAFAGQNEIITSFKTCINTIVEIYGESLPRSRFNGMPLFYSLYCVIFDLLFGLRGSTYQRNIEFNNTLFTRTRSVIENIESILEDSIIQSGKVRPDADPEIKRFIETFTRHTTDKDIRVERHNYILNLIVSYLQ